MPAALITEAAANPAEADYLAGELARDGIEVRCVQDTGIPADPGLVILIPLVNTPVTAAVLDRLPGLRLIATRSTGTDHIDVDEAARRGITIRNVADYGSVAVAEYTFALLLTPTRMRLHPAPGFDLSGKTIGVIGTGAIGRHVSRAGQSGGPLNARTGQQADGTPRTTTTAVHVMHALSADEPSIRPAKPPCPRQPPATPPPGTLRSARSLDMVPSYLSGKALNPAAMPPGRVRWTATAEQARSEPPSRCPVGASLSVLSG